MKPFVIDIKALNGQIAQREYANMVISKIEIEDISRFIEQQ